MQQFLVVLLAYLLGSFPTAYLAGRWLRKADIRQMGGGNMGALNATRELGSRAGAAVLLIDIAKGAGAVLIAEALTLSYPWVYAAGVAAVTGHCWPLYLKFKGGKGAATAIGICLALAPFPLLCSLPAALAVIWFTSNITLGMAAGFLLLPFFEWLFREPWQLIIYLIFLILFLALRYLGTARRNLAKTGWRDFLIERNFTPWQTTRHRKSEIRPPKSKTTAK